MTCRVFGPPIRMAAHNNQGDQEADVLGCCELCFIGASESEIAGEMPIPHALESHLLSETTQSGETIVAFALLP